MIDQTYLNVLRTIHMQLRDTNVNWALTGSLSLALQGVAVEPHDIDLQTDAAGAYGIERLFSEYVIRKVMLSATEKICSHFGALMIDGLKVEIMGDIQKRLPDGKWEQPVELDRYKRLVEINTMQVPVLSLEYEYQAYLKLGRLEKARMIKDVLLKQ